MSNLKKRIITIIIGISILFFSLSIGLISFLTFTSHTRRTWDTIEELLREMTLEEKIGQMTQAERQSLNPGDIAQYFLGSVLSGGGSAPGVGTSSWWDGTDMPSTNTPESWKKMHDIFQAETLNTRLEIPIIYGIDAVHGHGNVYGATIFPHNIGLGATRDVNLMKEISTITASELKATGIRWNFGPCFAVARDIRWGRTYESFGEEPEIAEMFAAASVKGYQGEQLNANSIVATAKHYVADGGTTWGTGIPRYSPDWQLLGGLGIDHGNAEIDMETLRTIHLPAYLEAIDAGVGSIMVSFSSVNGIKMHENEYLITDVLKSELGFEGFVISDWDGINEIPGEYYDKVVASVNAGIDMFMIPYAWESFIQTLYEAVENGDVSMNRIDDAVSRILGIKMKMKLFENPFVNQSWDYQDEFGSDAHRNVARKAVRKSLVLLKNDNVFPLLNNQSIFVAGRNADDLGAQCGGWTMSWQGNRGNITEGKTILDGIKEQADNVYYSINGTGAAGYDVAIVVIGEDPYAEYIGDDDDLSLYEEDVQCLNNVYTAGIPVVTILVSGRPMIVTDHLDNWNALVAAWLPGTEGDGVAEVIFGEDNFSGTLPFSWPINMNPVNIDNESYIPLFEYGYGLNY